MITVRIPIKIPEEDLLNYITCLIKQGTLSFEINIDALTNKEFDQLEKIFYLIKDKKIEMIINIEEPYLGPLIQGLVSELSLRKQVKYAGSVNPLYFSLRDRLNIYYNVENCLPNFYQFEILKKSHFDVIHYFSQKYKVKTLRIDVEALSKNFLCWADENDLQLSVVGVDTYEQAEKLKEMGINQVTTSDIQMMNEEIPQKT